jgi:RND family efflux transporter MFP subunit
MERKTKRILLITGILFGAVLAAVGMTLLKSEPPKKPAAQIELLVDVMPLDSMQADFEIFSQGTVRPRTETALSAEISGTIISISPKFIAGGVFAKNEVLMQIDPSNYTAVVQQAKAVVHQRQIEFDGAEKLRSQGYRAEAELASAAAALATAEAELIRANRNFERTFIRLPYEGMVRSKDADLGQFVNPGTKLGVTFATDYAEVRLPLTDLDLAFVTLPDAKEIAASGTAIGPMLTLSATQRGQLQEWEGHVVRSEGVVDESSRVTYAVARIDDPYRLHGEGVALPMGTFVVAKIKGESASDIIRVPQAAIRGADQLIFLDDDNKIRIQVVTIVRSDAEFAYISAGASPGERIVSTALDNPINGTKVRTTDDLPTESEADAVLADKSDE